MLSVVLVCVVVHAGGHVGDHLHTCTCPPSPLYGVCSAGESILLRSGSGIPKFYRNLFSVEQCTANRCCIWGWGFGIRFKGLCNVMTWLLFPQVLHVRARLNCFDFSSTLPENEPVVSLSLLFLLCFECSRRDSAQITGSILCYHSDPREPPQSVITAPLQSRSFIIFAAQTFWDSFRFRWWEM